MQEKSFGLFCAAGPKEHLAARRNRMEYQAPETLGLRQRKKGRNFSLAFFSLFVTNRRGPS